MIASMLLSLAVLSGSWDTPGPHGVASAKMSLAAPYRSRPIELRATYPTDKGKHPLLVFSHGFRGSKDNYAPLAVHWASHGYVVLQPTHTDSAQYLSGREKLRALDTRGGRAFSNWAERPKDIAFILDHLADIEQRVPAIRGRIDTRSIGIGGHSFGAHTTQLTAGARTITGQEFAERRAKAFVMLSPQGTSPLFREDAWKGMKSPCLFATGSDDLSITKTTPEQRKQPYRFCPPGDKYLLWIEGGTHGFGGISGARFPTSGPDNGVHLNAVKATTLAFWDAYLKGSSDAKRYLLSNRVSKESEGVATLSHK